MSKSIIEVTGLCKSFNEQRVLVDLSLNITEGNFTVIMGSSGAGKSTIMYCISGMDTFDSGKVIFDGDDISGYNDEQRAVFRRKKCGFIFQKGCFMSNLTIIDNIVAAGLLVNKNRKAVVEETKALLESVNIKDTIWKKYPNQVSGGELQRASIIRGIINKPKVLFADEPTGALNSINSIAVLDNLTKINKDGQSVIMVTHDIISACRADEIIYLKDGQIFGTLKLEKYNDDNFEERKAEVNKFLVGMGW